jgi:hypothetical protein
LKNLGCVLAHTGRRVRAPSVKHRLGQLELCIRVDSSFSLLPAAALCKQSERSRDPKDLKSESEDIPDDKRQEQIDEGSHYAFAEDLPGIAHASIRRISRRVLENVFRILGNELIETGVQSGEKVRSGPGQRLRDSFQIGPARGAELSLFQVVSAARRAKHLETSHLRSTANNTPISVVIKS